MDNIINFFANINFPYVPVAFLLGLVMAAILNKFIPEFIIFSAVGFFFNILFPRVFTTLNSLNLFSYYTFLILFFIGLNFPWREVNLIRRKLYRCFSGIYISMLALVTLTIVALGHYASYLPEILKNNFFILPYLMLLFFSPDICQLKNKLAVLKTKGPLTVFSENICLLLNTLTLFILLFSFHNNISNIWLYIFIKAIFILLLALLLQKTNLSENLSKLFLIAALFIFIDPGFRSNGLLPLFSGIILSFFNKNNKSFLKNNLIDTLNFIAYFLAGQFFVFSYTSLLVGFSLFLIYQLAFRLTCYIWGRWELNESIYKNIGGLLANPGLLPVFILIGLYLEKINSIDFSLLISSALFFKLFCFIIWHFESTSRLIKAGESNIT